MASARILGRGVPFGGKWQRMRIAGRRLPEEQAYLHTYITDTLFAHVDPADGVSIRNTITDEILEDLYVHSGLYDRDN